MNAEVSDPLDAATIGNGLAARGESIEVEVLSRCPSTNSELLIRGSAQTPALLIADQQTAGRGRRGRRWHASPGDALMFSLSWSFAGDAGRLRGLSLAVGVSIAHTLRELGASGVALKWPNDLLASMALSKDSDNAKLGGILIETRAGGGRITAVIGVGLNYRRNPALETQLNRKVAAIEDSIDPLPSRNELAVRVVRGLAQTLRVFGDAGFEAFRSDWVALHALEGSPMRVRTSHGRVVAGIAEGIAADGGLLLRNRRGVHCIHSGTVVRESPARGADA